MFAISLLAFKITANATVPTSKSAAAAGAIGGKPTVIVAFGDSLMAGYGLPNADAFPVQLQRALKAKGFDLRVINAGVSGDTTAGGAARFDWAVPREADAVILGLGANDALRGLPVDQAQRNLAAILDKIKARGLPVLLTGVPSPANWGDAYQRDFAQMYPQLADTYDAVLYRNFLDEVALKPDLNLSDGLHPNAKGVAVIVKRILPKVIELLNRVKVAS
ncbi:MAG: arylesterase [Pseudomonadota bacterium]